MTSTERDPANQQRDHVVIIGAGPAGLTAAYELQRAGCSVAVLEKDALVGGISRTDTYKGYRYDIGGHRFFSKSAIVNEWWEAMLSDEMLLRPRLSRIFFGGKFFDYPLKAMNAVFGLGLLEAVRCVCSYAYARCFPVATEANFEDWVSNRFGRRLFEIFFKTYTEKVWGIPCTELSADWAAQRIKNLNLFVAVKNALIGNFLSRGPVVTSLIDEFKYPRLGPGQMWERVAQRLDESGYPVRKHARVSRIVHAQGQVTKVVYRDEAGVEHEEPGDQFLSTMPMGELIRALDPPAPDRVLAAADGLRYRDFLTVGLIIDRPASFPDNWIYVHSADVKVGRIQNFAAWSPDMVPEEGRSSLGLEYFVQENDELWSASDADLVALGTQEVDRLGLVDAATVVDGCVIRMPKAYPVYDDEYKARVSTMRAHLAAVAPNMQLLGRNGQHRYNNQDHSMLTAIYAARNILGQTADDGSPYDIWEVNTEQEYHEESDRQKSEPRPERQGFPGLIPAGSAGDTRLMLVTQALLRYDAVALGAAGAVSCGLIVFLATAAILLRGGAGPASPNLALLANYLVGFELSWAGALVGLVEASLVGFVLGASIALQSNALVSLYERRVLRLAELNETFALSAGD
ncbi:MAG: FAD-binding protein [Myxococcaceae bacterium]|nr:FAD-binding protein [Myxococcaceae bacterium]